jgi:hypothetical protein
VPAKIVRITAENCRLRVIQLPEKYKENFDISSEDASLGKAEVLLVYFRVVETLSIRCYLALYVVI